jgi:hypothetical protein
MAQAAVAGVAADAAAQAAGQVAERAMQKTIEFLDQDVISWSRATTKTKISPDGRRKIEETTKWSAGVKVWELGIVLAAITIWEGLQILQQDISQLHVSSAWVEQALLDISIGVIPGEIIGSEAKKLPAMGAMSAMQVLDAQLAVLFAQVLGPLNLSGGQIINGLITQLSKRGQL